MLNKLNKLRSKSRRGGDDAEASQYPKGRKLGHGTFSTVFLTTDPRTGKEGALKVRAETTTTVRLARHSV
jgi:serine/threonine protein kinase